MVDVNPTVDWNPLGEVFYRYITYLNSISLSRTPLEGSNSSKYTCSLTSRKSELYTMHWTVDQVDLAGFMVAAAPYGGPIGQFQPFSFDVWTGS